MYLHKKKETNRSGCWCSVKHTVFGIHGAWIYLQEVLLLVNRPILVSVMYGYQWLFTEGRRLLYTLYTSYRWDLRHMLMLMWTWLVEGCKAEIRRVAGCIVRLSSRHRQFVWLWAHTNQHTPHPSISTPSTYGHCCLSTCSIFKSCFSLLVMK